MHIIFMLQIVMWITILPLYHYALFIESYHDSYWFGFWDWETCSEANLNSYQTFKKCKAFILACVIFFNLVSPWIDDSSGVLYFFIGFE